MNQKSLFSLIGLVVFISVSVGCKASNPVQTQSAVENSQSAGTQSMEYDKRKVEDTLMKYFDSLNKDSLDVYNSVVKKGSLTFWWAGHLL